MIRVLFTAAAVALASPAQADDCPTGADLATGILLARTEAPITALYRIEDGGLVLHNKARGRSITTTYPHGLASGVRDDGKSVIAFRYSGDLSSLDHIRAKRTIERGVTLEINGTAVDSGSVKWTYQDQGTVEIGNFSYDVWRVRVETLLKQNDIKPMDQYYAPELGISVRTTTLDSAGNVLRGVVFDRIEKERP